MPKTPDSTPISKGIRRSLSQREAVDAYRRLELVRIGQRQVVRFSPGRCLEHLVLTILVIGLSITGLAQTFDNTEFGRQVLIGLGGLEAAQSVHHLLGLVLAASGILHALIAVDSSFVRREKSKIMPHLSDLQLFLATLKFNLGLSKKLPLSDRYSLDEKIIYWLVVISVGILVVTGIVLWNPLWITQIIPGSLFAFAKLFHRWQAILVFGSVLLMHSYQVISHKGNFSIFTGKMSLKEMEEYHPLELAFLEMAASVAQSKTWPQSIEYSVIERTLYKKESGSNERFAENFDFKSEPPFESQRSEITKRETGESILPVEMQGEKAAGVEAKVEERVENEALTGQKENSDKEILTVNSKEPLTRIPESGEPEQ